jgi:diguanylate cyclase (GGDEF)-like protein
VAEGDPVLDEREAAVFQKAIDGREMQRDEDLWVFALRIEDKVLACLTVEGAQATDLAKFEVLVAHLVLQIKKIRLYMTVRALSIVDGLTQVFVRRHFMELFVEELNRSIKHKLSLALLMLDIDHFKRYNDELGHLVGDATLKEVASILRSSVRKVDVVARFGGEEFIILIPETNAEGAREAAERIRSNVARHTFRVYDVTTKVTTSLGIALFPEDVPKEFHTNFHQDLPLELIRRSDRALYHAKEEGRNRVITYKELKE